MRKLIFILSAILTFSSCKKDHPQTHHCNCNTVKAKVFPFQCVTTPCLGFGLELENGTLVYPENFNEFDYNPKAGDSLMLCLIYDSITAQPAITVSVSCMEGVSHLYSATCKETPPVGEFCLAYFERWFYNKSTKKCNKIGYSGCSQSGFATQAECEECKQCH